MDEEVKIPRIEVVALLYKLKHMRTLIEILLSVDDQSAKTVLSRTLLENLSDCETGIEFHCIIKTIPVVLGLEKPDDPNFC